MRHGNQRFVPGVAAAICPHRRSAKEAVVERPGAVSNIWHGVDRFRLTVG